MFPNSYRLCYPGNASVTNGMATVIVDGLECELTYIILARGTTLKGDLQAPKSSHGDFPTCGCPIDTMGEFCVSICTYLAI